MEWGGGKMEMKGSGEKGILGVADTAHPVPTETATFLESSGELGACIGVGTAVLGAPDVRGGFPFAGAAVE